MRNLLFVYFLCIFIMIDGIGQHLSMSKSYQTDIKIRLSAPLNTTGKLIGFLADQNFLVDTVKPFGNLIHYKNPKGLSQGLYYLAFSEGETIQFMVDSDQTFEMSLDIKDPFNTFVVKGSKETELLYTTSKWENQFLPDLQASVEKMKTLNIEDPAYIAAKKRKTDIEEAKQSYIDEMLRKNPNSLFAKYKCGGQNPKLDESLPDQMQVAKYRYDFWNTVDFSDDRLLATPMIHNKLKRYFGKDLSPQNQDTLISLAHHLFDKVLTNKEYYKFFVNWFLFQYEPGKCPVMDAEAIFVDITRTYVTKDRAFWADDAVIKAIAQRANEMAPSRLKLQAPNVISNAPDGQTKELYKLTADYIVVYLYNPDCEHCQEESPKLLEFYHKNRGMIDVFAIALDTDTKKWNDYIAKVGMDWTNVYDPTNRSIYGKYWVDVTPEMYLLNKERKIIGKNLKTFQLQTVIDQNK